MTHPMLDWLTAQLDADEWVARSAQEQAPTPWTHRDGMVVASGIVRNCSMHPDEDLWDNEGSDTLETSPIVAKHIALHDPAAVLADIASKRAIIELHRELTAANGMRHGCCEECSPQGAASVGYGDCPTLRALASAYRHRSGYDPSWAPT